jgi:hypothetical protein
LNSFLVYVSNSSCYSTYNKVKQAILAISRMSNVHNAIMRYEQKDKFTLQKSVLPQYCPLWVKWFLTSHNKDSKNFTQKCRLCFEVNSIFQFKLLISLIWHQLWWTFWLTMNRCVVIFAIITKDFNYARKVKNEIIIFLKIFIRNLLTCNIMSVMIWQWQCR